jgi:hypothetical protein
LRSVRSAEQSGALDEVFTECFDGKGVPGRLISCSDAAREGECLVAGAVTGSDDEHARFWRPADSHSRTVDGDCPLVSRTGRARKASVHLVPYADVSTSVRNSVGVWDERKQSFDCEVRARLCVSPLLDVRNGLSVSDVGRVEVELSATPSVGTAVLVSTGGVVISDAPRSALLHPAITKTVPAIVASLRRAEVFIAAVTVAATRSANSYTLATVDDFAVPTPDRSQGERRALPPRAPTT